MQLTQHFRLTEWVPKAIYGVFCDHSIWFLDQRIVMVADRLAEMLGKKITVNNWAVGGQYDLSGYRSPDEKTGAFRSQHKRGAACDLKVEGMTPDEVRQFIRDNFTELNKLGLTTIEQDTPTWTHADCRWTGLPTLLEVPFS